MPGPTTGGQSGGELAELLAWLDGHTNLEQSLPGRIAPPTLERISALCHLLGDPQDAYRVLHVTGTNGKGSTVRMLAALLGARGLRVGVYTSPDLHRVNERIARGDEPIPDEDLVEILAELRRLEPLLPAPASRFELLTAAGFLWFADAGVDVAVVEVGLGGRWDATNVVRPDVTVVTNIGYDHVDLLGPTLEDIAGEKAGIIKAGAPAVVAETSPGLRRIFAERARTVGTRIVGRPEHFDCRANRPAVGGRLVDLVAPRGTYLEVLLGLHGAHQGVNAATAVAAAEEFFDAPLPRELVDEALGSVRVPGRLEVLGRDPLVVLDGAHNVPGIESLARALTEELVVPGPTVVVLGMLRGRDPAAMLQVLRGAGVAAVLACPAPSPRRIEPEELTAAARHVGLDAVAFDEVGLALEAARAAAGEDGRVVVCGSLYVVAAARARLLEEIPRTGAPTVERKPERG